MTKKLYHEDPYLQEFSSEVIEEKQVNGKPAVVLKQTAFYPTSGGQPHDLGTLNAIAVVDVIEDQNHRIAHLLEEPLKGRRVTGLIDWQRRLDHMQQHTGQHVLSQVFSNKFEAETISFHLGEESATIDLDKSGLGHDAINGVEIFANRIIFENRDQKELKILAKKILNAATATVILFGAKSEGKASLLFQRSEELPFDMGQLMKKACTVIKGRGGGRPQQAQGGGPDVDNLANALQDAENTLFERRKKWAVAD